MAKVLLIYPKPEEYKNSRFGFSLNLLYLSSILKQNNHTIVDYIDFSLYTYDENKIYERLDICDYVIIEMDSFSLKRSNNITNAEFLLKKIKEINPSVKTIAFGYDISLYPRDVPFADYSFTSNNYESKILEIINQKEITFNFIKSFDLLPFPDRSLLSEYIEHGGSIIHKTNLMKSTLIQTSRGCLNKCTFCQRKGWYNKYLTHSVDYVISEFEYLSKNNYINIWIADDNFTFNLERAKNILLELINRKISTKMKIACSSWTKIDKEFLKLAKKANISVISFGVESADRNILRFYNKDVDLKYTCELINYANEIGLYTVGNFILGAPMETDETISKTFNFALKTPFDQVNIKILDYMIGAELFDNLPQSMKKGKRHIFACKEVGLNNFYLSELKNKINDFKIKFKKSRETMLKNKLLKYGKPYEVRKFT